MRINQHGHWPEDVIEDIAEVKFGKILYEKTINFFTEKKVHLSLTKHL